MKKSVGFAAVCFSLWLLSSCSLKYGNDVFDESVIPEFIFDNSEFSRYEENVKTMSLKAAKLEQYKTGKSMYGQQVEFSLFDKKGELETSGECGLLAANTKEERYALYDKIVINSKKDDVKIKAESLKWNGKSEQLVSGRNDVVSIEKGGTVMRGSGFSASGVSRKFIFTGYVNGDIDTDKKSVDETEEEPLMIDDAAGFEHVTAPGEADE